jgi:diacylglycerol kinase family enzyme
MRYAVSTVRAWRALDRTSAPMTLTSPRGRVPGLPMVIATNTDPWSYLGPHRLRPTPLASFDLGIDVSAPLAMSAHRTLTSVGRMLTHRPASPQTTYSAHDLPWVEVVSERPVALQADGDYLGQVDGVRLTAVPRALRVLTV